MIKNLQLYLDKGLLKSDFVNLKARQFSAETSHEFIEWCGVIGGNRNTKLIKNIKIKINDLYIDFTNEYPDYAPKSRMAVSRVRFSKWLHSYGVYKYKCDPLQGRDKIGKWIEFVDKSHYEVQSSLSV